MADKSSTFDPLAEATSSSLPERMSAELAAENPKYPAQMRATPEDTSPRAEPDAADKLRTLDKQAYFSIAKATGQEATPKGLDEHLDFMSQTREAAFALVGGGPRGPKRVPTRTPPRAKSAAAARCAGCSAHAEHAEGTRAKSDSTPDFEDDFLHAGNGGPFQEGTPARYNVTGEPPAPAAQQNSQYGAFEPLWGAPATEGTFPAGASRPIFERPPSPAADPAAFSLSPRNFAAPPEEVDLLNGGGPFGEGAPAHFEVTGEPPAPATSADRYKGAFDSLWGAPATESTFPAGATRETFRR